MTADRLLTGALTAPVDRADLPPRPARVLATELLGWLIVSLLTWLFLGAIALGLSFVPPQPLWALLPAGIATVITLGLLWSAVRPNPAYRTRLVRLGRFASANAMTFTERPETPHTGPGLLFGQGVRPSTRDVVRMSEPRDIELGQHHFSYGRSTAESSDWAYATTPLSGPQLPHLVLRARGKWTDFTLPGSTDQSLGTPELEGPGAEAFVVLAPIGRTATVRSLLDATLFRSDVLARLTERPVHVEVVEGRLYLYRHESLVTEDPDTWRWILALVDDVAAVLEDPATEL